MAMYWPEQKVAMDIVDDPYAQHIDDNQLRGWSVLRVTVAQMSDLEEWRQAMDALCQMLGQEPPEKTPEWLAANERLFNEFHGRDIYYRW